MDDEDDPFWDNIPDAPAAIIGVGDDDDDDDGAEEDDEEEDGLGIPVDVVVNDPFAVAPIWEDILDMPPVVPGITELTAKRELNNLFSAQHELLLRKSIPELEALIKTPNNGIIPIPFGFLPSGGPAGDHFPESKYQILNDSFWRHDTGPGSELYHPTLHQNFVALTDKRVREGEEVPVSDRFLDDARKNKLILISDIYRNAAVRVLNYIDAVQQLPEGHPHKHIPSKTTEQHLLGKYLVLKAEYALITSPEYKERLRQTFKGARRKPVSNLTNYELALQNSDPLRLVSQEDYLSGDYAIEGPRSHDFTDMYGIHRGVFLATKSGERGALTTIIQNVEREMENVLLEIEETIKTTRGGQMATRHGPEFYEFTPTTKFGYDRPPELRFHEGEVLERAVGGREAMARNLPSEEDTFPLSAFPSPHSMQILAGYFFDDLEETSTSLPPQELVNLHHIALSQPDFQYGGLSRPVDKKGIRQHQFLDAPLNRMRVYNIMQDTNILGADFPEGVNPFEPQMLYTMGYEAGGLGRRSDTRGWLNNLAVIERSMSKKDFEHAMNMKLSRKTFKDFVKANQTLAPVHSVEAIKEALTGTRKRRRF
jgi:hypothetical protein